ncbi:hypothetical protein Gotur_013553 [Gossypium turneri]
MWENWYDHIPTREPTIVVELAFAPDYMPWFRIHGKSYLLLEEQRGPLNPKRRDDDMGPSTVPTQSPSPMPQPTTLTLQPLQIMPGAYPCSYMYPNPYMFHFPSPMLGWNGWPSAYPFPMTPTQPTIYRPPSQEGSYEAPLGSSSHYQSPSPCGIQTPPP